MTLEEAIKTAIGYEEKVRDVYHSAMSAATNDVGKRVFKMLAKEEQGHVEYLHDKLKEWQESGTVTSGACQTVSPCSPADRISPPPRVHRADTTAGPWRLRSSDPFWASHIFTAPSIPAERSLLPSGLKLTLVTGRECPLKLTS